MDIKCEACGKGIDKDEFVSRCSLYDGRVFFGENFSFCGECSNEMWQHVADRSRPYMHDCGIDDCVETAANEFVFRTIRDTARCAWYREKKGLALCRVGNSFQFKLVTKAEKEEMEKNAAKERIERHDTV